MRSATSDLRRQDAAQAAAAGNRALRTAARGPTQSRIGRARRAPPRGRRPAARSAATRGRAAASGVGARADGDRATPGKTPSDDWQAIRSGWLRARASWKNRCASRERPRAIHGPRPAPAGAVPRPTSPTPRLRRRRVRRPRRSAGRSCPTGCSNPPTRCVRRPMTPAACADQPRRRILRIACAIRSAPQQDVARSLERVAEALASGTSTGDAESRKLSDQLARAQELRDKLAATARDLEKRASRSVRPASDESQASAGRSSGKPDR